MIPTIMAAKKKSYPIRTRFTKDIVAEVMLPERQTGKVAIFCSGLPSVPHKRGVLEFLAAQGYVTIFPRYRGTWESEGSFLEKSPAQDIEDVINDLVHHKSIRDLATGERVSIKVSAVHLFGSSFGGPAVLMNSHLKVVKKIIAISPVIDWKKEGEDEPFDFFVRFTQDAFGGAYRLRQKSDWQKLIKTDFYDPIAHTDTINGKKILIIHAKDDTVVPVEPVIPFAEKTGATYYLKPHGGHGLDLRHGFLWKKIEAFLKKH
jgi:pimeloyl-ACP methyl ester carboxylesterase